MIRHTLVIAVINTFYRLTVDTDGMAWMRQGITERLSSLSLLRKALAAGAVTITGMLTTTHFKFATSPSPSAAFCGFSSSFLILKF